MRGDLADPTSAKTPVVRTFSNSVDQELIIIGTFTPGHLLCGRCLHGATLTTPCSVEFSCFVCQSTVRLLDLEPIPRSSLRRPLGDATKPADPMPRTKGPVIRTEIPNPKAFIATSIEERIDIIESRVLGADNDGTTSPMVADETPPRPDITRSYADTLMELLQQERSRNEDLQKKVTEVQKLAGEWRSRALLWEGGLQECEVELTRERGNHGETKAALKLAQDALEQERLKAAEEHLSQKQKLKKEHEAEKNKVTAELSRIIQEERKRHEGEVKEWESTKMFWESLKGKY